MRFKEEYAALNLLRLWMEKEKNTRVAFSYFNYPCFTNSSLSEIFVEIEDSLIPKKAINTMSHKPVSTPKLKVTDESLAEYIKASERGYLSIFKFENALLSKLVLQEDEAIVIDLDSNSKFNQFSVDELNELLSKAIEEENYELAAKIRDFIKGK